MIVAAGILFITEQGRVLLLKRAPAGDHPGEYCTPGGKVEEGETLEKAAVREAFEECGKKVPTSKLTVLCRTITGQGVTDIPPESAEAPAVLVVPNEEVDYTTFLMKIKEEFEVELCDENTGYAWADINDLPQPLHPGVLIALARLTADELGIARMLAMGDLTSPQTYHNVTLFDIRITGTGVSFRDVDDEYVYRPPENYLNEEFIARCNGLSVIWKHPAGKTLNSKEFTNRVVGSILLAYIKKDEVWGIAKVYDDEAIKLMSSNQLSTSPTVSFHDNTNKKVTADDGKAILMEGRPALLDHVAICERGVWDKGGSPAGVRNDNQRTAPMTEEKKIDAPAVDLGALMAAVSGIADGMKSLSARMDSAEEERKADKKADEDKAKADAEKDEKDKADKKKADAAINEKQNLGKADAKKADCDGTRSAADKKADGMDDMSDEEKAEKEKADAAKADAEKDEKEKDDRAKADAATIKALTSSHANLAAQLQRVERGLSLSDADAALISGAQAKADAAYSGFGLRAPRPLLGETLAGYKRRLVTGLKSYSDTWKGVDLVSMADESTFGIAETQIYAAADHAARHPKDLGEGELRMIPKRDSAGREIREFFGDPSSWMRQFQQPDMFCTGFNTKPNG